MSGNKLLLDTNIILYYLSGDGKLGPLLEESDLYISIITEIELMGYSGFKKEDLEDVQKFLSFCTVRRLNERVKDQAIQLRRKNKLKLPDAIILATALVYEIPFLTADKDFKKIKSGQIVIYEN